MLTLVISYHRVEPSPALRGLGFGHKRAAGFLPLATGLDAPRGSTAIRISAFPPRTSNHHEYIVTMSVGIEIVWSLTPKGQTKPVWEKSVSSREQKTTGDAFAGVKRLRLATEAATKENIRKALTQLSQQQLTAPAAK